MRKVLFPVLLFLLLAAHAVAAAADSVAVNIPDETLNYKVMFNGDSSTRRQARQN